MNQLNKGLLFIFLLFSFQGYAQIQRCLTHETMVAFEKNNPKAQTKAEFEEWIAARIAEMKKTDGNDKSRPGGLSYTIPIVFHIIHNGEAVGTTRNLSAAKINAQISQLNLDYANQTGSGWAQAADTKIQFCAATIDPQGAVLAEPGIDRVNRNTKGFSAQPHTNGYIESTVKPATIWDPTKYFNVWVDEIDNDILGVATFPIGSGVAGLGGSTNDDATHSGVMIDYRSVGSVLSPGAFGTSYGLGRTLTHEAGHWLGLRHIWGDASCGDDFVGDTPTQSTQTAGCPTGVPTSCSNASLGGNMYQNYMDYSDDNCVNTFTAEQRDRMQAVMMNSNFRKTLGTSMACSTPRSLYFNAMSNVVAETSGSGSGCNNYTDYTIPLNIIGSANGNALVTIQTGGTATLNKDYTISPVSFNYTNGSNSANNITIRVFDDAAIEANETVVLSFTISGTGVIAGNKNQVFTLTIIDDDIDANKGGSNTSVTLLSENFNNSTSLPTGWSVNNYRPASTTNRWVVGANGNLSGTGNGAMITNNATTKVAQYTNSITETMLVTPVINTSGYSKVHLSFKYRVAGEIDANDIYDFGMLTYSLDGQHFSFIPDANNKPYLFVNQNSVNNFNLELPAELWNRNIYIGFKWINDGGVRNNPPLQIDDVVITGTSRPIETALNASKSENIYPSTTNYFYSSNGKILASISNISEDIACVAATITQAGNGRDAFITDVDNYQRSNKVITLVPAIANSTASYTLTLYYTTDEVAAWGVEAPNLKIVKIDDGQPLTNTFTAATAAIYSPVFTDLRSTKGYVAYTINVDEGFSQFILASAAVALPVKLLNFTATAAAKTINLHWQTAQEQNNSGFYVERSLDNQNFTPIKWVSGNGTTSTNHQYSLIDAEVSPGVRYYYRLKQIDFDGKFEYSPIRTAIIENRMMAVTVTPNPAKDWVRIGGFENTQLINLSIINTVGQEVYKEKLLVNGSSVMVNTSGFAAGVYIIKGETNAQKFTQKLIVE